MYVFCQQGKNSKRVEWEKRAEGQILKHKHWCVYYLYIQKLKEEFTQLWITQQVRNYPWVFNIYTKICTEYYITQIKHSWVVSSLPCDLRWGIHSFLKCQNLLDGDKNTHWYRRSSLRTPWYLNSGHSRAFVYCFYHKSHIVLSVLQLLKHPWKPGTKNPVLVTAELYLRNRLFYVHLSHLEQGWLKWQRNLL